MKVIDILSSIDAAGIVLPEFQRGYVWNRHQVRSLMHSLYRHYPVGSLLVWLTRPDSEQTRGGGQLSTGAVRLLLDGQQRITMLYDIMRGSRRSYSRATSRPLRTCTSTSTSRRSSSTASSR